MAIPRTRRTSIPIDQHVNEEHEERPQKQHALGLGLDKEDGFVALRLGRQLSLAGALDEDRSYVATANQRNIKEVGSLVEEFGDQLCRDYEITWKHHLQKLNQNVNLIDKVIETLRTALATVDAVFEYLENTGHNMLEDIKMHEGVLRGILSFSELAFQLEIFTFLKLLVKCIDVPKDPYPAEREHIIKSLENIDSQETVILSLIERGGAILTSIIREKALDMNKAVEFDDVIRRATLEITVCKRNLERLEPVIENLLWKTNTIKWFSRGVRLCGIGLSWSYLYMKYKHSNVSLPIALGGSMVSGLIWLSFFPSRSYKLYDSLRSLQYVNQRLDDKLKDLYERMKSHESQKWKLVGGTPGL